MKNEIFDNRELSWLKFNLRVLEEADDESNPPLERLRFLSIVTSNLDEFFMVRVGGIIDRIISGDDQKDDKTGLTLSKQLEMIYKSTADFYKKKRPVYQRAIEALRENKIRISSVDTLFGGRKNILDKKFASAIRPLLSVQIVNSKNPFPHLENKNVYFAVHLTQKDKSVLGLVIKSRELEEIISLEQKESHEFVLTDDVINEYAPSLFPGFKIVDNCMLRVTRNADTDILRREFQEEADYRLKMKKILKKRKRLAPVRIEISKQISKDFKKLILNKQKSEMLIVNKNPLSFNFVSELIKALPKEIKDRLSYPPFTPKIPQWFTPNTDMFAKLLDGDILLYYPYHSMRPFTAFLEQAAKDEHVSSVKITLYRVNTNSRVINALINAAEYGKDVLAVMELRARFDEESNINYSELLENNGVRVIYGPEDYKVHSKVCTVIRSENGKTKYYTHIGTGNYNENTARLYTDLNLLTSDDTIGKDAMQFFDNLSTDNLFYNYKMLCVSPDGIENKIISELTALIENQKQNGNLRAVLKCNSLTEKSVILKIIEACENDVKIDMIVRGISCLVPATPKLKENLRIISIVGRFLEHSRVYAFYKGDETAVYISSADLMTRNLKKRVEAAVPINDEILKKRITDSLEIMLSDDVKARELKEDGKYIAVPTEKGIDSQKHFTQHISDGFSKNSVSKKQEKSDEKEIPKSTKKFGNFFKWLISK